MGKFILGVLQDSILGLLFFNIFLWNLFLFAIDANIANYADDNKPYVSENRSCKGIESLKEFSGNMFAWFKKKQNKTTEKCQLLLSKKKPSAAVILQKRSTNVQQMLALRSKNSSLLLLSISLHSKCHTCNMLKKSTPKLNALTRIAFSLSQMKGKTVMRGYINFLFLYCFLVWMMYNRTMDKKQT